MIVPWWEVGREDLCAFRRSCRPTKLSFVNVDKDGFICGIMHTKLETSAGISTLIPSLGYTCSRQSG